MILGEGVKAAEDSFHSGCTCGGEGADCQFNGCECLADLEDHSGDEYESGSALKPRKAYAYHSQGLKAGLLRSKLLDSSSPLYECHSGCSCSTACPNRVVERGRTLPLEIFRTRTRGWGKLGQIISRDGS